MPFLVLLDTNGEHPVEWGEEHNALFQFPSLATSYMYREPSSLYKTKLSWYALFRHDASRQRIPSSLFPILVGSCSVDVGDDFCKAVGFSRLILRQEHRYPQKKLKLGHCTPQRWLATMQIEVVRRKAGINSQFHMWSCRWQRFGRALVKLLTPRTVSRHRLLPAITLAASPCA